MQTKKDYSVGVVPLCKNGDGSFDVLLVHQISYRGKDDRFWIFPKGHPEGNESTEETALRELLEETGVLKVSLETNEMFSMGYNFVHENIRIEKKVDYFIGYVESKDTHISQPHEVAELKWCSFGEAKTLLTHQNTKNILHDVEQYLTGSK